MKNEKLVKSMELSMKGYTTQEITSFLILTYRTLKYKKATEIASKASWLASPQGNE